MIRTFEITYRVELDDSEEPKIDPDELTDELIVAAINDARIMANRGDAPIVKEVVR